MTEYKDEHPYRMKLFEIAVESAMGIVSMLICSWISDKLKEHDEREREERERRDEMDTKLLNRSVVASTAMTKVYGALWMEIPEAKEAYNGYLRNGIFDDPQINEMIMIESEEPDFPDVEL